MLTDEKRIKYIQDKEAAERKKEESFRSARENERLEVRRWLDQHVSEKQHRKLKEKL